MTDSILPVITAYSPTGDEIDRTYETIAAGSHISCFYLDDDGKLRYEHAGDTDEFWDACETVTRNGKVVFLDASGEEWTADQLVFKDTEGNVVQAPIGWDDAKPTHDDRQAMAARAMLAALDSLVANGFTDEELARRWSWSVSCITNARAAIAQAKAAGITGER